MYDLKILYNKRGQEGYPPFYSPVDIRMMADIKGLGKIYVGDWITNIIKRDANLNYYTNRKVCIVNDKCWITVDDSGLLVYKHLILNFRELINLEIPTIEEKIKHFNFM